MLRDENDLEYATTQLKADFGDLRAAIGDADRREARCRGAAPIPRSSARCSTSSDDMDMLRDRSRRIAPVHARYPQRSGDNGRRTAPHDVIAHARTNLHQQWLGLGEGAGQRLFGRGEDCFSMSSGSAPVEYDGMAVKGLIADAWLVEMVRRFNRCRTSRSWMPTLSASHFAEASRPKGVDAPISRRSGTWPRATGTRRTSHWCRRTTVSAAAWVHATSCTGSRATKSNAGYWYRRAGKPHTKASLEEEWDRDRRDALSSTEESAV